MQIHGPTHSGKSTSVAVIATASWKRLKCMLCFLKEHPKPLVITGEHQLLPRGVPYQTLSTDYSRASCKSLRIICDQHGGESADAKVVDAKKEEIRISCLVIRDLSPRSNSRSNLLHQSSKTRNACWFGCCISPFPQTKDLV